MRGRHFGWRDWGRRSYLLRFLFLLRRFRCLMLWGRGRGIFLLVYELVRGVKRGVDDFLWNELVKFVACTIAC